MSTTTTSAGLGLARQAMRAMGRASTTNTSTQDWREWAARATGRERAAADGVCLSSEGSVRPCPGRSSRKGVATGEEEAEGIRMGIFF
jgi:hypothetical protein